VIGRSSFFVVLVVLMVVVGCFVWLVDVRDNLSDLSDSRLFRCISVVCLFFWIKNIYKKAINYYVIIINKTKIMLK
jgi:hypothetical protein